MTPKIKLTIQEFEVEGIDPSEAVNRFQHMKTELEALGCEVNISFGGLPIEIIAIEDVPMSPPEIIKFEVE